VVDDFGEKYISKEDVNHLIVSLQSNYTLTKDWMGNLYCGISLQWDYINRTVDNSKPGYTRKKLQEYGHIIPKQIQSCPYSPEPKQFGSEVQSPLPPDSTSKLDKKGVKRIQQMVRSILYYARAVDMTVLIALSTIAIEQTKATEMTMGQCMQLLDYLASNQEAKVRFHALDMIMNIHSGASYLSMKWVREAAPEDIFSWAGSQEMGSQ
jgi:hypothetical protein